MLKKSFGSCNFTLASFNGFFTGLVLFLSLSLPNPERESFAIRTPGICIVPLPKNKILVNNVYAINL